MGSAHDSSPEFCGTPPKTSAAMRAVLKHVHAANADAASDLLYGSARRSMKEFIPAAEFRRAREAKEFAAKLHRRRIPCKIVRRGRHRFVHVAAVHLDEALALGVTFRRQRRQRQLAERQTTNHSAESSFSFDSFRTFFRLIAVLVGAAIGRWAMGHVINDGHFESDFVGVVGGGLIGYFTSMGCASMIGDIRKYLARRAALSVAAPPVEEVEPPRSSTWSTLLTISRNRKSMRSLAASAPSSATSRS